MADGAGVAPRGEAVVHEGAERGASGAAGVAVERVVGRTAHGGAVAPCSLRELVELVDALVNVAVDRGELHAEGGEPLGHGAARQGRPVLGELGEGLLDVVDAQSPR